MATAESHIVEASRVTIFRQAKRRGIIHQGSLHVASPEYVGDSGVLGAQRLPSSKWKSITASEQGATHRNSRKSLRVRILKENSLAGKTIQIRRIDPIVAIAS